MKHTVILFALLLTSFAVHAQTIYSRSFGEPNDKPIIFLHGGPGYNAVGFEATTAQKLSENGFYVIVYDRRGEGRSLDNKAKFTFQQTFDDLSDIYEKFKLQKATLIGHSFGGVVATLFAEKYPEKINAVVLVGTPMVMQETLTTIRQSSKKIYQEDNDQVNLKYIEMLENMDHQSLEYSSYCFMHAMQNRFYTPENISEEAQHIYANFKSDSLLIKYASEMTYEAPKGFWKNEKYTSINLYQSLSNALDNKMLFFGLIWERRWSFF